MSSKPSKEAIIQTIKAGNAREGVRLFALLFRQKHPFLIIAPKCPSVLFDALAHKYQIPRVSSRDQPPPAPQNKRGIREDYPFLNHPHCPKELKALVGDKITAYHTYTEYHPQLFGVTNNQEGFQVVKTVVEAWIENRAIHMELEYYAKHGVVLGKHPIFNELNELTEIRKLSVIELPTKAKQLEHNIWRIKSQLEKSAQKHLRVEREKRRARKERQLAEVYRLIALAKKK